MKNKRIFAVIAIALGLIVLFFLAARDYAGSYYYGKFRQTRERAKSVQSELDRLEIYLNKAVRFAPRRAYFEAKGSLYLDMALSENQFGSEGKRDEFLDKAKEVFERQISMYPASAFAYYSLGRTYMLYNFPLLTYATKGRAYFRKALLLQPSDEFLNVNILAVILSQWDLLMTEEKDDLHNRLKNALDHNEDIFYKIRDLWKKDYGSLDRIKEILSRYPDLWARIQKFL
jgi:tetratricopeptide (TPR) repeat protein